MSLNSKIHTLLFIKIHFLQLWNLWFGHFNTYIQTFSFSIVHKSIPSYPLQCNANTVLMQCDNNFWHCLKVEQCYQFQGNVSRELYLLVPLLMPISVTPCSRVYVNTNLVFRLIFLSTSPNISTIMEHNPSSLNWQTTLIS